MGVVGLDMINNNSPHRKTPSFVRPDRFVSSKVANRNYIFEGEEIQIDPDV
jgi:hypothetical protein